MTHHLAKLREPGLVTSTMRGVWTFYSLAPDLPPAVRTALDLIPQMRRPR